MNRLKLTWSRLLNAERRKDKHRRPGAAEKPPARKSEFRTELERDHDRILFSTPVRRLADKTQVFPLERHDSVRTRLTHSHEVANLARSELDDAMRQDFLRFEGNAQTLRLVTRLQILNDDFGLNLTYGTLAALLKYPVGSVGVQKGSPARKKHGFFQSEKAIVEEVWRETDLCEGQPDLRELPEGLRVAAQHDADPLP